MRAGVTLLSYSNDSRAADPAHVQPQASYDYVSCELLSGELGAASYTRAGPVHT